MPPSSDHQPVPWNISEETIGPAVRRSIIQYDLDNSGNKHLKASEAFHSGQNFKVCTIGRGPPSSQHKATPDRKVRIQKVISISVKDSSERNIRDVCENRSVLILPYYRFLAKEMLRVQFVFKWFCHFPLE